MDDKLLEGDHVDIYLLGGNMVRGIVTSIIPNKMVVVSKLPAIHTPHGTPIAYEKVMINSSQISSIGFREETTD